MATERQPVESPYPAWPPPYEQSAWLDVTNKTIRLEGDPETPEGFAAAYDFLHVVTVYFKTEYGSTSSPTQRGLWWMVTAEDIKDELEHRNQWAQWDARRRQQTDETATANAVTLAHVLALSYRRLQALQGIGGVQRREYPLFLHLHEKIREARLQEAALEQMLRSGEDLPPVSPFLRTPAWRLLQETHERYDAATQINTIIYGDGGQARYSFAIIDPFRPYRPETKSEHERHAFSTQEQAVAVHYEYQDLGYIVSAVVDSQENRTLLEPWESFG